MIENVIFRSFLFNIRQCFLPVRLGASAGICLVRDKVMVKRFSKGARGAVCVIASAVFALQAGAAAAQSSSRPGLESEQYVPNIWIDPDGCEHWVMDDGAEGFMTPHVNRNGIPVCREGSVCGLVESDTFFAPGSFAISDFGRTKLVQFFRQSEFRTFSVAGHTDSVDSDAANMELSLNRANAVAAIAREAGVRISTVQGYGERKPAASNDTAAGRAQNRRVEIICVS